MLIYDNKNLGGGGTGTSIPLRQKSGGAIASTHLVTVILPSHFVVHLWVPLLLFSQMTASQQPTDNIWKILNS